MTERPGHGPWRISRFAAGPGLAELPALYPWPVLPNLFVRLVSSPGCFAHFHLIWKGGGSWTGKTSNPCRFFETMSKRRKGFPSERQVKRGVRIVHGHKELVEKLGRNDLCPCGSGKRFRRCCLKSGYF